MSTDTAAVVAEPEKHSYAERFLRRTSAPATSAARRSSARSLIVVIAFGFTAQNFFTPVNFSNLIGQMVGTCMLAYGVVFVLLIGEIDLSIGYVSGVAGMIAALLANPSPAGPGLPGWLCIADRARLHDDHRRLPGLVRRADRRAVVRGHARRPADLAGRDPARAARA